MCGLSYVCKVWVGERDLVTILVSTVSYLMYISVVMDCVTVCVLNLSSFFHSTQTKLRIFNTNVKAVLLYGCETWKNSKSITAKLQVFINKCLRKILRIFWLDQITNRTLWKCTNQPRIDLQIRKRKWGWLGHTLRKTADDIARQWVHIFNALQSAPTPTACYAASAIPWTEAT